MIPGSDEAQFVTVYKTPVGTRVEVATGIATKLEEAVKKVLGKDFTVQITDSGIPAGRAALFSANTGPHAGTLQVNLVPKTMRDTTGVQAMEAVRASLRDALPGVRRFYTSGGIVKRVLSFGSPAPIDVEILGYGLDAGSKLAKDLFMGLCSLTDDDDRRPLLTDAQTSREENYPELDVKVDRLRRAYWD